MECVSTVNHNNSNRVERILRNFGYYGRMSFHQIQAGIPIYDIARSQFPMLSPHPPKPVLLTIEFTNYCNLSCVYCRASRGFRKTGMMNYSTCSKVLDGVKHLGINRVRVVGGGEPTLHPEFELLLRDVTSSTKYASVLSNGQWRDPRRVIHSLLAARVNLIEVSVEGTTKRAYEQSSKRGSFTRLLTNLSQLRKERDKARSRSHINLRVMVRPSDRGKEPGLRAFWKPYCDSMVFQRLIQFNGLEGVEDLFKPVQKGQQKYPNCSSPSKSMLVNWDGNIPLCCYSAAQCGPQDFILGNINEDSLLDIWNGDILRTYRQAHRERVPDEMPICMGCGGI